MKKVRILQKKIAARMQRNSKARILLSKILVRNPEIHGWISGSMFSAMQIQICQKNPKKIATSSTIVVVLVWMWRNSKARILLSKILVRNPKIHGWIFGSIPSAMQIESFLKKLRHIEHYRCCARLDVAAQEGENFASQNSRQESENPWMDFRFLKLRKSLFYKKNLRPAVEQWR